MHCSRASNKHGSLRCEENPMTTGTQWKVKLERLRGFCVFFVVNMVGTLRNAQKKNEASSKFSFLVD